MSNPLKLIAGIVCGAVVLAGGVAGASAFVFQSAGGGERTALSGPAIVELGQFAAPITRTDGVRGMLLVQARVAVDNQDLSLSLSRNMPQMRHAVLREIYRIAGRGEGRLSVDDTAAALAAAVDAAHGAPIAEAVYVDRLLVQ